MKVHITTKVTRKTFDNSMQNTAQVIRDRSLRTGRNPLVLIDEFAAVSKYTLSPMAAQLVALADSTSIQQAEVLIMSRSQSSTPYDSCTSFEEVTHKVAHQLVVYSLTRLIVV